ncbi:flagellin N-terminal helical domain-containing protein [Ferdinandcohnia sp. Marseille-Q9671]
MRINHNIAALNTHRQLTSASNAQSNSMEKLASGLRINKAGDDAAGLAISEKMRGQIRGLDQASRNAQDGISLIQTAEGALNETHDILQRMRELAVQSSNDTSTSTDRTEIQKEVDQLAEELTRISNTTEFNTKNLLGGGHNSTFQIGANSGQNMSISIKAMDAFSLGVASNATTADVSSATGINGAEVVGTPGTLLADGASITISAQQKADVQSSFSIDGVKISSVDGGAYQDDLWNGKDIEIVQATGASASSTANINSSTGKLTITVGTGTDSGSLATDATTLASQINTALTAASLSTGFTAASDTSTTFTGGVATTGTFASGADNSNIITVTASSGTDSATTDVSKTATSVSFTDSKFSGLTFDKSASVNTTLAGTISIDSSASNAAVTNNGKVVTEAVAAKGISVSSQSDADAAITTINNAIETVSSERSKLGAFQNRLEHTINNLGTSAENLTAAESRIRDVDMAKEMMNQTKNSILSQAAQAMLAQANQQPQGVLQLLR